MLQPAVFDSSFWIHAHRAGLLRYLNRRYALHYTQEVADELDPRFPSGRAFRRAAAAGRLRLVIPSRRTATDFGPGERSVMNVCLERDDWIGFIDDRRPFERASALHLRVSCSPALLVLLYADGSIRLGTAHRILALLHAMGTLSPVLINEAEARLHEEGLPRHGRAAERSFG